MRLSKQIQTLLRIKEVIFLVLAICSILFLLVDLLEVQTPEQAKALYIFDVTVGMLFITEFIVEFYFTTEKRYYIKHNWVYLLAAIPLSNETTELLRVIRIIRVVKAFRFGVSYVYGHKKMKQKLRKRDL